MRPRTYRSSLLFIAALALLPCFRGMAQDWTHYVRTSGHGCDISILHEVMEDARNTGLFGIEVDNDISGRYNSFLDPDPKLKAIKAMADSAHAAGNYAFIYNAGLECITENLTPGTSSFYRDHPDWVQRNRKGDPAMFGSGNAFWIPENSEDIWISPFAPEWRKIYMEQIRKIAATGIDGVYIDIPYWMTHFTGWEDTWASFDTYTVNEFKRRTGIDAMKDFAPGDWNDPDFRTWIDFRISSLTEFMAEIDRNVKSVNPACKTIAEIYPGLGEEVPRVGSDVYELYPVVDAVAHEFNVGENSARRTRAQWMEYMTGMFTFRAFAEGKPSWMLSYSWDGEEKIAPADAIGNLMMSQMVAGTNSWDARRFVMSGSNDYEARKRIFQWIAANEKLIYATRENLSPVGIYFSPKTRNYFAEEWTKSYQGMMSLMLNQHLEFEIITPRTMHKAQSKIILFPDIKCLGSEELDQMQRWVKEGRTLIATGETGKFDPKGNKMAESLNLQQLLDGNYITDKIEGTPEKDYLRSLNEASDSSFNAVNPDAGRILSSIRNSRNYHPAVTVNNAQGCIAQICRIAGKPAVFIGNFSGLISRENARQQPAGNISLTFHNLPVEMKARMVPFLGSEVQLQSEWSNGDLVVHLPEISRGAIIRLE